MHFGACQNYPSTGGLSHLAHLCNFCCLRYLHKLYSASSIAVDLMQTHNVQIGFLHFAVQTGLLYSTAAGMYRSALDLHPPVWTARSLVRFGG